MQITSKKQEKIVLGLLLKNGTVDNFIALIKESLQDLVLIFIILESKVIK